MRAFPHLLDTPLTIGLRRSGGGLGQGSAERGALCGTSTRNSATESDSLCPNSPIALTPDHPEVKASPLGSTPNGGAEGTRTPDPLHAMEVRYQLRHSPVGSAQHTRGPLAIVGECGRW